MKPNGVIVVKENITSSGEIETDVQDSSVTRPMKAYHDLFTKAGLDCYRQVKQLHFPKEIYSVYMFVLRTVPNNSGERDSSNGIVNVCEINNHISKIQEIDINVSTETTELNVTV